MSALSTAGEPPATAGRRSILRNFGSVFFGRLFAAFSMWLALVVLAKLSNPETVGIYALAQALCIPVAETAKMGLREIRASDTVGTYRFGDYVGLRLIATSVALLVMLGAGLVQDAAGLVFWVIALYALTRCLELLSDITYVLFQAQERMDYIGWSLCLVGPLSLLLLSLGYWVSGSLVVAVLGQVLAQAIVLLLYDLPVGRRRAAVTGEALRPIWNPPALRALALQSVPLVFASVLVLIALYVPRLVVEHSLGLTKLGYFAAILALAMAPSRLVNSMGMAVSVPLARLHANGQRGAFLRFLGRMVLAAAAFGLVGVVLGAAFGEAVLRVVYTEQYAVHAELLVWLIAAAALRFMADVLQFGMIASRRFWWIATQYGVVAIVALVSAWALIPSHGLTGAGMTMVLIFLAQLTVISIGLLCNLPRASEPR
jgi:O-antigen/teichoic acid export membrane protein